jgi:hypothetical protein
MSVFHVLQTLLHKDMKISREILKDFALVFNIHLTMDLIVIVLLAIILVKLALESMIQIVLNVPILVGLVYQHCKIH